MWLISLHYFSSVFGLFGHNLCNSDDITSLNVYETSNFSGKRHKYLTPKSGRINSELVGLFYTSIIYNLRLAALENYTDCNSLPYQILFYFFREQCENVSYKLYIKTKKLNHKLNSTNG